MASLSSLSCFLFFIVCLSAVMHICVGASKEFKVGDSEGWRVPLGNVSDFYSQWAGTKRFHVGDSLVFEYNKDSVFQVDKYGYYHCNTSHPISKYNNGNNIFHLKKPGPTYLISGTHDHCKNGQRLLINVMLLHPISRSPPSIAKPPDPMSYMASAPSPHSGSDGLGLASLGLVALLSASVYFA